MAWRVSLYAEFSEKVIYSLQGYANKYLIGNTGFWKRAKFIYLFCFDAEVVYLFLNHCINPQS